MKVHGDLMTKTCKLVIEDPRREGLSSRTRPVQHCLFVVAKQ